MAGWLSMVEHEQLLADNDMHRSLTNSPQGDNNVRVTYLNKMDLKGKVPAPMLAGIAAEMPALVGKLRDFYYECESMNWQGSASISLL
jgi:hypothetical protein